jgi:hypothetical protein
MIKELRDLKPKVDVLEPGKLKSSRGGAPQFSYPECQVEVNRRNDPYRVSPICRDCAITG